MHDLKLSLDNRIVKYYIGFMNNKITNFEQLKEQLPDDFKMSDKNTLLLIQTVFELTRDNNELIQLLDRRIKLLELKLKN